MRWCMWRLPELLFIFLVDCPQDVSNKFMMFLPSCPHSISSNRLFIMVTGVRVSVRDRSILSLLTGEFPVDGSSHFVSLVETKCFALGNKMFQALKHVVYLYDKQVINCIDSASYLYYMVHHFMRFRRLRNLQFIQHLIQYRFR